VPAPAADDKDEALKLTPQQLDMAVRKSAKKANDLYKGKTIELTGKVIRVNRHFSGKPVVELMAANEFSGVQCFTKDKNPWATFAPGQTVKVTGKFPDFPVVAQLEECAVEAVTKSTLREATADELAREAAADPAGKKLAKATLKVTGTVASSEFNAKTNFTTVVLKGAGKTDVECQLIPAEKDAGAALKPGQKATVVGQFGGTFENKVHLTGAVVVTEEK